MATRPLASIQSQSCIGRIISANTTRVMPPTRKSTSIRKVTATSPAPGWLTRR